MINNIKYNEFLVQQVKQGSLAIENTNRDKLIDLMEYIFPEQYPPLGDRKYYRAVDEKHWTTNDIPTLPTRPVEDFIIEQISNEELKSAQDLFINKDFQKRVVDWMMECFRVEVIYDVMERNHRFLEEALELVQSLGCTKSEAEQLVDYVFNRPVGEPIQEVGGVMVTLAALCNAAGLNMMEGAETELARIWTIIDKIREKHANKPKNSPLPQIVPLSDKIINAAAEESALKASDCEADNHEHDCNCSAHEEGFVAGVKYAQNLSINKDLAAKIYDALNELVAVKKINDTEGRTIDFIVRQPKAWEAAKELILTYPDQEAFINSLNLK